MHMRKLILGGLICIAFACTNDTPITAPPPKVVATAQAIPATPPQTTPTGQQSNIIRDKSRSKGTIDANFPFDITLQDAEGQLHNSSSILKKNGKPTVVLFWLTTCYPCRIEMKAIQSEIDQWKTETDFNIVAISTDFEKNYGSFVKMVNKNNWSFDAYIDVNREFRKVMPGGLNGLPQSFIFDKDGNIAYHKRKYSTGDEHKLYAKVKELAAK